MCNEDIRLETDDGTDLRLIDNFDTCLDLTCRLLLKKYYLINTVCILSSTNENPLETYIE
jgi:hypothetical protein